MNVFLRLQFFSSSLRNKHTHERPSLPFGLWGRCRNFEIAIFDKCNVRLKYGFRKLFLLFGHCQVMMLLHIDLLHFHLPLLRSSKSW